MKNLICISTGFLYRLTDDRNEMISKIKEFSPDGIEVSFAHPENLFDFETNQENLKYLQSLKFNSIHAPWKDIVYSNNQKSNNVLRTIEKLYKQIEARNVVFHKEQLGDVNMLNDYDFVASIENADWREVGNNTEEIEAILNENKNLKFTFDFAHTLTVSSDEIPLYINKFRDRLVQIHLAMLNKNLKDHWFLYKYDNKEIRTLLSHLKNTNVPLVLECVASDQNEIKLIKEEIKYIKTILKTN